MAAARLLLEDGTVLEGESFGSDVASTGEIVFTTSCTGYPETATPPSYRFQIVVMTSPHMGNYGIDESVEQSEQPQVAGFVVRELSLEPSHPQSEMSLDEYFKRHKVAGIHGVDTRAITRKIRSDGAMRGMISTDLRRGVDDLTAEIKRAPSMSGLDLVQKVTALRAFAIDSDPGSSGRRIAVYDYGVKKDILRQLTRLGCDVVVYPATTHPDEIVQAGFDGVVLSNGPGDPE